MADVLHSIFIVSAMVLFMVTSSTILTIGYVGVLNPLLVRLKWWWRLRNTHIITVGLDRNDLSLCDDHATTIGVQTYSLTSQVAHWCHFNMSGRHGCIPTFNYDHETKAFYFEKSEDAFMFKMKWV